MFEVSVACYPEPHPDSRGWDFDLAHLKAKQETEKGRSEFKEKNHKIGMEFEEKGDIEEAKKYF